MDPRKSYYNARSVYFIFCNSKVKHKNHLDRIIFKTSDHCKLAFRGVCSHSESTLFFMDGASLNSYTSLAMKAITLPPVPMCKFHIYVYTTHSRGTSLQHPRNILNIAEHLRSEICNSYPQQWRSRGTGTLCISRFLATNVLMAELKGIETSFWYIPI